MPPVNPPRGSATDSSAAQVEGGGTGFSLTGFMSDLAEQNQVREQRQQAQLAAAQEQRNIMQESSRIASEQAKNMSFLKTDFDIARAKTQHSRELEDGSLFDQLRLVGLQMMDPAGYDPAERDKRLVEDSRQAALLSQYYGYQQDALKTKLAGSTANLDYLKNLEAIGHEKLTAFADSAALLHQNIVAMQSMKDDALMNLDQDQVSAAIAQAQRNPNKTANIGGIDVDLGTLTDRQTALYDRSFANLAKKTALILAQDEAAHTDNILADREYDRAVQKDARDNLGIDLQIKNAQRRAQAQTLIDEAQKREARSWSLKEIQTLRDNNYKSPSGEQYNPDVVEEAYRVRKQAETDQINDALTKNALQNFDLSQVAQERTRVQQSLQRFKPGTPVASAAQEYYNALGVTATGIGPENGLVTRVTAMQGFAAAKDKFDKVLQAQAVADGKGDKNLTELRLEWYRGNPIPQETLANAAVERLTKLKSVADIFPADIAPKIEKKYRELIQQKTNRGQFDLGPNMSESDRKIAQAEAAQEAIDWGVNQGLAGQSDQIVASQVTDPTHPMYGMTPNAFATHVAQADFDARKQWQKQAGLSDAEAQQVDNGIQPVGKDPIQKLVADRKYLENINLMLRMDVLRPGAGHELSQWWADKGQNYIQNIQNMFDNSSSGSFQSTNFASQTGQTMQNSFAQYAATLQQSDSAYQSEFAKRNADMLSFNNSPQNAQIAILTQTPGLSDKDRRQIYGTVIQPLLQQAKAKGMDFQQTNEFVESQIQNYVPQTPMMKELMRVTKKDRPEVLAQLNSWRSELSRWVNFSADDRPNHPELADWYKQYMRENGVQEQNTTPWIFTYRKPQ